MTPDEEVDLLLAQCEQEKRIRRIRDRALQDVMYRAFVRSYNARIAQDDTTLPEELRTLVARLGKEAFVTPKREGSKMWFITISAKDDIDPKKFISTMDKCRQKQLLQSVKGFYTLEQRATLDDPKPYGFHIHWLVEFESFISKSVIVQQVFQCFRKFVAGMNYIDVRQVHSPVEWEVKLKYIQGEKKSADKTAKVRRDEIVRAALNVPKLFSH